MSLHHVINPNVIIKAALIVKTHISAHVMASMNVNKNELKLYNNKTILLKLICFLDNLSSLF